MKMVGTAVCEATGVEKRREKEEGPPARLGSEASGPSRACRTPRGSPQSVATRDLYFMAGMFVYGPLRAPITVSSSQFLARGSPVFGACDTWMRRPPRSALVSTASARLPLPSKVDHDHDFDLRARF